MKILFISSNLIGDSILSTGILSYLIKNRENANLTIVTGPTAGEIFLNFPKIDKIITIKKMKFRIHWLILWYKLIGSKWDLIIDLRSSLLSYFLITKERKIYRNNNELITQVEKLSNFIGTKKIHSPIIYTKVEDELKAKSLIANHTVVAIAPGGNWRPKIWPIENFLNLIIDLDAEYKNDIKFLLIGSIKEKKYYDYLLSKLSKKLLINFMGQNLNLTYCSLKLCKFFIGNDSGLMHLSAASGIPTIGLFGPTKDEWYKPYGEKCYVIRTKENLEELRKNVDPNISLMNSIKTKDVINFIKVKKLLENE